MVPVFGDEREIINDNAAINVCQQQIQLGIEPVVDTININ